LKSWCTGKDSNLRTSLGGTDLQSVGFNHSPTCAETFGRCGYGAGSAPPSVHRLSRGLEALAPNPRKTTRVTAFFSQYLFRNTGKPRPAKDAVKTTTRR